MPMFTHRVLDGAKGRAEGCSPSSRYGHSARFILAEAASFRPALDSDSLR